MKRKIALLVFCVAGVLVILGLLAFAYAPHITAAALSTTSLTSPPPGDSSMVSNTNVDDSEEPVLVPVQHVGRACDGDSGQSADAGY